MKNVCDICGKDFQTTKIGSGYATGKNGIKTCYTCYAIFDKETMLIDGHSKRLPLYLSEVRSTINGSFSYKITNWPGTLDFNVICYKEGKHNIAETRLDTWFNVNGYIWHGVQYGDFTQIIHCKKTKTLTKDF